MARQIKRTRPGNAANLFVRCLLSDASAMLGGFTDEEWQKTLDYFDSKCAYSGEVLNRHTLVKDHAIPINKDYCGLHLYGNVFPCTKEANNEKGHQHYREFVTDPDRLNKIESFISDSDYFDRITPLGDLQAYCRTQYEVITGLCSHNRRFLERSTGIMSDNALGDDEKLLVEVGQEIDPENDVDNRILTIILDPSPATIFKEELLRTKRAWITIHYKDDREENREWNAHNFKASSNVFGNLRSRPEFRQGEWQRRDIKHVIVSIRHPSAHRHED